MSDYKQLVIKDAQISRGWKHRIKPVSGNQQKAAPSGSTRCNEPFGTWNIIKQARNAIKRMFYALMRNELKTSEEKNRMKEQALKKMNDGRETANSIIDLLLLHVCSSHGMGDWLDHLVSHLISSGANINVKDENNETPLHRLLLQHEYRAARMLIDLGADINARSETGLTPLLVLCYEVFLMRTTWEEAGLVELLLTKGASVDATDSQGRSPLHVVCRRNPESSIIRVLLMHAADVNATNSDGETPLMALQRSYSKKTNDIIRSLISSGADVQATDNEGNSVLPHAVKYGRIHNIATLCTHGVSVNARNAEGATPLITLCQRNLDGWAKEDMIECICTLLAYGAKVNATDNAGHTALWWLKRKQRHTAVQYLKGQGGRVIKAKRRKLTQQVSTSR